MTEFLIGGIFTIIIFGIGFVAGLLAGKNELKTAVEKVVKQTVAKHAKPDGGPVKPLDPEQLAKQKSRELMDRLGL